jgi:hypothetical protein
MFNKNKQKDYHNALANSFNRKKTRENEAARFQNIHPKINSVIRVDINEQNALDATEIQVTDVYKMDSIQTSVSIPLNMRNNDENIIIPKIELKEIVIPTYSDNDKYDIATINKNINQTIEMDIYNLDDNFDYDISKLYRKKIQTISNVYQESYTENIKPTGLGDFIRGCYFLLQFCSKYKFQPKIIINHPIAVFLEKFYKGFLIPLLRVIPLLRLVRLIPMFTENNWKDSRFDTANYIVDTVTNNKTIGDYVTYLCSLKVTNNTVFSYNIMFPYDEICEDHKKYMRDLLEPTEEIQLYVDSTLEMIGFYKNGYSVIHIRSGDKYLNDDTKIFDTAYFKKLIYEVNLLINFNSDISYLLIADNNEIKMLLVERFPCLKAIFKSITHIGEGTILEREKVKNTMLDFYLMANANSINSYTCYAHGSGFSYWCATTYNIPHKCMYINIK